MRLAEIPNEYGTGTTLYLCDSCGRSYTVCPAINPEKDANWNNCLAPDCGSYDPSRDMDKLFDDRGVLKPEHRGNLNRRKNNG